jgi:hypothetical protein
VSGQALVEDAMRWVTRVAGDEDYSEALRIVVGLAARVEVMERDIEAAFEAGWNAYIRQQTPSGDSQDVQEAFAEWRRIGRPL